MNRKFLIYLTIFLFLSATSAAASGIDENYKKYRDIILSETFLIRGEYLFVAGKAKIKSASASSFTLAQKMALATLERNIAKIKLADHSASGNIILESWLSIADLKYTAKNRVDIDKFSRDGYFYHIAAYKLSDIEFEDKTPITWERIYNDFKKNPDKRDELLFYEIIPENELPALKDVVENNIAKQYGKNFALMFMGKDVPPIPQKRYDAAKKASEKYNNDTSLKILIITANTLPYDKNLCNLLAEKFDKMQMRRCAAVMAARAGNSKKWSIRKTAVGTQMDDTVSPRGKTVDTQTGKTNFIDML